MGHNCISLIQKSYDLHKNLYQVLKTFPKGDRYSLGQEIKLNSLQMLELLFEAESAQKDWKTPLLQKASVKLSLLKLLIRLANDLGILDDKKTLITQEQLQEIGRMLGGWIKYVG